MKDGFKEMLAGFLLEGDEDDIYFGQITNDVAKSLGLDPWKLTSSDAEKVWNESMEFVPVMLRNGFIAVDIAHESKYKFAPWPDQNPQAVMEKIKARYIQHLRDNVEPSFVVWFRKVERRVRL